jgi:hypothetical protein
MEQTRSNRQGNANECHDRSSTLSIPSSAYVWRSSSRTLGFGGVSTTPLVRIGLRQRNSVSDRSFGVQFGASTNQRAPLLLSPTFNINNYFRVRQGIRIKTMVGPATKMAIINTSNSKHLAKLDQSAFAYFHWKKVKHRLESCLLPLHRSPQPHHPIHPPKKMSSKKFQERNLSTLAHSNSLLSCSACTCPFFLLPW